MAIKSRPLPIEVPVEGLNQARFQPLATKKPRSIKRRGFCHLYLFSRNSIQSIIDAISQIPATTGITITPMNANAVMHKKAIHA